MSTNLLLSSRAEPAEALVGDLKARLDDTDSDDLDDVDEKAIKAVIPKRTPQDVQKADKWLKRVHPIVAGSIRRRVMGAAVTTSATSVGLSGSFNSADDAAAASGALAKATRHLDQILREGAVDDEHGVEVYLKKINKLPQSRLPPGSYQPYTPTPDHLSLISEAAVASKKIYHPPDGLLCVPGGDDKACSIWHTKINGQGTLIVAVRGTASLEDVYVDVNSDPEACARLLGGMALWHKGFLRIAENMESSIVARIAELRGRFGGTEDAIKSVLFTGHSLGGGIAQILFTIAFTNGTKLFEAVNGLKVHCITFAAPPVSTLPIRPPPGLGPFLAFINEGDPVPLAQEAYIKTLISIYALTPESFQEQCGKAASPDPIFHVSGDCVVLKDEYPDDPDRTSWIAVRVTARILERAIFGNPWMHMMDQYTENLACLSTG